jgi:hypothetical protein
MRRRPPHGIDVTPQDRLDLENLVCNGSTPLRIARRAHILLAMADDQTRVQDLARQWRQTRQNIWCLCRRYQDKGMKAVFDAPRSGRPQQIPPLGARPD